MSKQDNLKDFLKDLHEGIASKKPGASKNPQNFRREIEAIETGVALDPLTNPASAEQILTGREAYDSDGNKITGTMNDNGTIDGTIDGINNESVEIPKGYTEGGTVSLASDIQDEVDIQEDLIDEITNILSNKMIGDNADVLKEVIEGSITECVIPYGTTTLKPQIFSGNANLIKVTIPNTVTTIGAYAFQSCQNVKEINVPDSVTSFGAYCFYDCRALTNAKIPYGVTTLQNYVFFRCWSLTSIEIPNTVTTIGSSVFNECRRIRYLFIPSSVTTLSSAALVIGTISEKATIRFEGTTPPSIQTNTFAIEHTERIEVPMSAVDTYKSATNWSAFADYIVGY